LVLILVQVTSDFFLKLQIIFEICEQFFLQENIKLRRGKTECFCIRKEIAFLRVGVAKRVSLRAWPQPRMGLVCFLDPPEISQTHHKTHLDPAEFCPFSKYCDFKEENCVF